MFQCCTCRLAFSYLHCFLLKFEGFSISYSGLLFKLRLFLVSGNQAVLNLGTGFHSVRVLRWLEFANQMNLTYFGQNSNSLSHAAVSRFSDC